MSAREVAARHARERARLAARMRRQAREAWRRVDRDRISVTWAAQLPGLLIALIASQRAAASTADDYLDAQEVAGGPRVNPAGFAGVASDGRDLGTLFALPGIITLQAIGQGQSVRRAMAAGGALAELAAHTQVADAGRTADQAALVARGVPGYTRMVVGKTCSRCIILAGRWYRWNAGFNRHPKCDCIGIPAAESAHELRTDPRKTFDSLSHAEQDEAFGKAGAAAIRDGADMSQVVNARRGMQTASVFGRDVLITTEGTTTRGVAGRRLGAFETGTKTAGSRYRVARSPRLMPEQIYREANGDREEANRLLKRFGYIL